MFASRLEHTLLRALLLLRYRCLTPLVPYVLATEHQYGILDLTCIQCDRMGVQRDLTVIRCDFRGIHQAACGTADGGDVARAKGARPREADIPFPPLMQSHPPI